jgi:ADP-ribose pyrophosphatase YjhB (NUDIX family)
LNPIVRPTGILIEGGKILLIKQKLNEQQNWSLPGGALEYGETIEQCLIREMKEETGINIVVKDLLYICDRFRTLKHHIVDISFLVERTDGKIELKSFSDKDGEVLCKIKMVSIEDILGYGFSDKFLYLIKNGFPKRGSYQGDFHTFYG